MDQDAADRLIFHLEGGGFAVLHREIHGGVIQLEALRALDFHGVVGPVLQREECTAIFVRGDGIDQLVVDLPNLKGDVGNALFGIICVDLNNLHAADGVIIEGQGLCILGIDLNGLDPGSFVDGVSLDGLGLLDHDGARDARNADLAVLVSGIETLAGEMSVIRIHIAAVCIGQFKLNPGKRLLRDGVQFPDNQGTLSLIVEAERLNFARLDLNALGGGVQDVSLHRLDLPGGHGGAGFQIVDDDAARLIGDVLAIGWTNDRAAGIGNQEGHTGQRRGGALDVLLDHQGGTGRVLKINFLRIIGIDLDGLGLMGRVDGVAGDSLHLRHYQGAHHAVDLDLPVLVGLIDTIAGDVAVFIGYILPGTGGHSEGDPLQGFASEGIPLVDDQAAGLGVGHDHRLGIPIGANHHVGGGLVHDVPLGRLDLRQDIGAGGQVGDADLARRVGGENTILSEGRIADDPVQSHLAAGGGSHPELGAGKGLPGGAVPLLDDELTLGLVLEGQAEGAPLFDLHGLALGVDDIARRCGDLRHHHALAGGQSLDADLTVLVRPVEAVAVADEGAVGIHDFELRIGQGHAGVGGADLADQQDAIRHIFEPHGDDTLLPAVR